jgi:DNA-binding NarL/FixJ family response regulator
MKFVFRSRVLLADHDPISRHVLTTVLRHAEGADAPVTLVGSVDGLLPVRRWPQLDHADVVVLSVAPNDDPSHTVRELVARGIQVLLIAASWTSQSLDRAMTAGATGCLIKSREMGRLPSAAHAVASGYLILSPSLLEIYQAGVVRRRSAGDAGHDTTRTPLTEREYEVLNLLAEGMSTAEAATELRVSPATVKSHVSHALPKLGARNRVEAVLMIKTDVSGVRDRNIPRPATGTRR